MGHPGGLGGLVPPLHPPPRGVSHGLGMELPGNPIPKPQDFGAEHPSQPCQPWAPGWSSRWEPQGWLCLREISKGRKVTKKSLNPQILTARAGSLWEPGKGEYKQGQGCPQSITGILQGP